MSDPAAIASEFNRSINRQSVAGLEALMTDDHRFVDSAGQVVEGKEACLAAWTGFFEALPDYRNHFDAMSVRDDLVVIQGPPCAQWLRSTARRCGPCRSPTARSASGASTTTTPRTVGH